MSKKQCPICGKELKPIYKQEWDRTGDVVARECPDVKKHFPNRGNWIVKQ